LAICAFNGDEFAKENEMRRSLAFVSGPVFILSLVSTAPLLAAPQSPERYRITESGESKFQEALDRTAADGYRLLIGDASVEFAIWERATDNVRRSYVFAPDVEKFLKDGKLQPGYRLVPSTFAADEFWFSAVFEKVEGNEQMRGYRFARAGSTGGLRKRFEQGGEGSSGVVAVAQGSPGAAVVYEPRADAPHAMIIASGDTGTLREQLQAAADKGHCIVDSDGIKEAVYATSPCAAGGMRSYEIIATTKTETFERELMSAAARGMRLVPQGLVGIEKRALMRAYNYETVGVVEKAADAAPVTYRVLATVRLGTFEKELHAAATEGYTLVAFAIGPKEIVGVLAK
jgi:hypothetical protein